MKKEYVKTLLYTYPHIRKTIERIDQIVMKKALNSMTEYDNCLLQCEYVVGLTMQKALLTEMFYYVDKVVSRFTKEERDCLDYKYFKSKPKEYFQNMDLSSRNYFRKQQYLINEVSKYLGWLGLGDEWFDKLCSGVPIVKKMLYSVKVSSPVSIKKSKAKNKCLQQIKKVA